MKKFLLSDAFLARAVIFVLLLMAVILFVPESEAQTPTPTTLSMCPTATVGTPKSACSSPKCMTPKTNDDIVLTTIGGLQRWQKWSTIPPTGEVRICSTTSTAQTWTTRDKVNITPPPGDIPSVGASPTSFAWTQPTTGDVLGYKLYMGTKSGSYSAPVDLGKVQRYEPTGLTPGPWFFAVTAYNAEKTEGPLSAELSIVIDPPKQPEPERAIYCTSSGRTATCEVR
jgi:hypothetical protein